MTTTLVITALIIIAGGALLIMFLLRRDRQTFDAASVGRRVDNALYLGAMPDPCADGHAELVYQFGTRLSTPAGPPHLVFEEAFCSVCTAPAPTPPWRDCRSCHANVAAGGLGLEFELEPCERHARNSEWDGKRWSV